MHVNVSVCMCMCLCETNLQVLDQQHILVDSCSFGWQQLLAGWLLQLLHMLLLSFLHFLGIGLPFLSLCSWRLDLHGLLLLALFGNFGYRRWCCRPCLQELLCTLLHLFLLLLVDFLSSLPDIAVLLVG